MKEEGDSCQFFSEKSVQLQRDSWMYRKKKWKRRFSQKRFPKCTHGQDGNRKCFQRHDEERSSLEKHCCARSKKCLMEKVNKPLKNGNKFRGGLTSLKGVGYNRSGESKVEESDSGPESEVQIIQLYSDSDAEEQKAPSDPDSQPSQDVPVTDKTKHFLSSVVSNNFVISNDTSVFESVTGTSFAQTPMEVNISPENLNGYLYKTPVGMWPADYDTLSIKSQFNRGVMDTLVSDQIPAHSAGCRINRVRVSPLRMSIQRLGTRRAAATASPRTNRPPVSVQASPRGGSSSSSGSESIRSMSMHSEMGFR